MRSAYGKAQGCLRKVSSVMSSINKVLDLQKCVDCLRNYTRMYGCYLMQCVSYRVYRKLDTLLPVYLYIYIYMCVCVCVTVHAMVVYAKSAVLCHLLTRYLIFKNVLIVYGIILECTDVT